MRNFTSPPRVICALPKREALAMLTSDDAGLYDRHIGGGDFHDRRQ